MEGVGVGGESALSSALLSFQISCRYSNTKQHQYYSAKLLNTVALNLDIKNIDIFPRRLPKMAEGQVLVLDGRDHLLGRLAAIVAKQVLLGL